MKEEISKCKKKIKGMQSKRKGCVNHGMKLSAKMACMACDASVNSLENGKLNLNTNTCTKLKEKCFGFLTDLTDESSNESPGNLRNPKFMKKYYEKKKKGFEEGSKMM